MANIEWFDDLTVGMTFKSRELQITESDIKRFAAEFDPQPMHMDAVAAQKTLFKGLAASGWHTAAVAMRLGVEVRTVRSSSAYRHGRPRFALDAACSAR